MDENETYTETEHDEADFEYESVDEAPPEVAQGEPTYTLSQLQELAAEHHQQQAAAQAREEALEPWREAVRAGQEYGDWSAYGQLVAEAQQAVVAKQQLETAATGKALSALDDVAEQLYPEAAASLSPDEMSRMGRQNWPEMTDSEWASAVMYTLATRQQELTGQGGQGQGSVPGEGGEPIAYIDDDGDITPAPSRGVLSGLSDSIRAELSESE